VARGWLERLAPQPPAGAWVIDPLGTAPLAALEAARAGYRVLVVSNNPVLAFLLEVLALAPPAADFQAALAALASTRRGEERLELHLRALYRTPCAACGEEVTAEAFLWRRGEAAPYARLYRCPACRDEGERPVTPLDIERLELAGKDHLHRARALERVAERDDGHYPAVQEALDSYLPRPLYVLQTLINKSEGAGISSGQRKLLQALLLSACDAASTLWPHPAARSRPRQLAVPPQFRENNLWLALEQAAAVWAGLCAAGPLAFTRWPDPPPPEGGVCLYAGRAKSLNLPEPFSPAAGLAVFPRPNQAFWTLSALWAGWLWGREAALPLHPFLARRRFDWNWHATAMHSPLLALDRLLPPGAPVAGLLSEVAPGFLGAALAAAAGAGMELEGLALRADEETAQVVWRASKVKTPAEGGSRAAFGAEAGQIFAKGVLAALEERGEPAEYLPLYAAGLEALARQGGLPGAALQLPGDLLSRLQSFTALVFADRARLRRFGSSAQEDERGLWWLAAPPAPAAPGLLPLADRIEMELVRLIQKKPGQTRAGLDDALCKAFPGLLTPPSELLDVLLESYGEQSPPGSGRWRLAAQEEPAVRRADLDEARKMLAALGERLGYTVSGEVPLVWTPREFGQVYFFYIVASSIVSKHVLAGLPGPSNQVVMVFPGGRARLLSYKLRGDPRLAQAIKGVHLLKFRHLRAIYERAGLTPALWEGLLDADPPFFEEAEQLHLF